MKYSDRTAVQRCFDEIEKIVGVLQYINMCSICRFHQSGSDQIREEVSGKLFNILREKYIDILIEQKQELIGRLKEYGVTYDGP